MHRPVPAALLALAVVLAGCSGVTSPSTTTDATTTDTPTAPETTTTYGTTTTAETTTTDAPRLAPGVAEDGVTDALALAEAHGDVLRDQSYASNATWTTRYANGSLASRTHRASRVDGPQLWFRFENRDEGVVPTFPETTYWRNESASFARLVAADGSVSYRRSPDVSGLRFDPGEWAEHVYGVVGSGSFAVAGEETRDGRTLYRLESTEPFTVVTAGSTGENASAWLLVDARGLVHEYRLAYDATRQDEPVRTTVHVEFAGVGSTTVERPAWVERAENETA